jgi:hypothetical protein
LTFAGQWDFTHGQPEIARHAPTQLPAGFFYWGVTNFAQGASCRLDKHFPGG